jgi:hypothetical protein
MNRAVIVLGLTLAAGTPAAALEQPFVWRDTDTGCAYLLTPQGGIAPRYRRDGLPDCPEAGSGVVDNAAREIARGLDTLKREMERLRDRNDRP